MLLALLFVPALVAIAVVLVRRPVRVLAEVAAPPATISGAVDPIATLDALLAELEGATLADNSVAQLEQLAEKLEAAAAPSERFVVAGREVYAWHPEGIARSKLWALLAGRGLGVTATARNWTTVTNLRALADE